jgi:hypothetical protein
MQFVWDYIFFAYFITIGINFEVFATLLNIIFISLALTILLFYHFRYFG